jgi:hypothetical protein
VYFVFADCDSVYRRNGNPKTDPVPNLAPIWIAAWMALSIKAMSAAGALPTLLLGVLCAAAQ